MASQNFLNAIKALEALTSEELNNLVPYWKQAAKLKRSMAGAAVVAKAGFKFGDILRWSSNKRGRPAHQYMKFSNMNRASTCVVGMECDKDGNILTPAPGKSGKWTVAIGFIDQVNGEALKK